MPLSSCFCRFRVLLHRLTISLHFDIISGEIMKGSRWPPPGLVRQHEEHSKGNDRKGWHNGPSPSLRAFFCCRLRIQPARSPSCRPGRFPCERHFKACDQADRSSFRAGIARTCFSRRAFSRADLSGAFFLRAANRRDCFACPRSFRERCCGSRSHRRSL